MQCQKFLMHMEILLFAKDSAIQFVSSEKQNLLNLEFQ